MDGAIFAADVWCADCAELVKQRIRGEGNAPADPNDQWSYDSGDYPKDCDVSCESDTPQHCAAGADCINAIDIGDGFKVGAWLENDLTMDGDDYVKDAVREGRTEPGGNAVTELWAACYDYLDFND